MRRPHCVLTQIGDLLICGVLPVKGIATAAPRVQA
jgi:hypothetical protein